MTLTELLESGQLEGYLPEAPSGGLISGAEIDRQVLRAALGADVVAAVGTVP